jgi:putative inorganic carbon (hco3(-)) transporter
MNLLYYLLFAFAPLIFTSTNSELFELPKMYFVYGLTLIILIVHLFNYFRGKNIFFRHTFLDWPLLIFLLSQIVSTFFSVDIHTSLFGYYSRLNGGLLSLLTYSLLYWILAVYLNDIFKTRLINIFLSSGFLIAAFGIAEHFGIDKNIWVQDVQARVFSTLGQPNWLAAYLCILLPFVVDKFLNKSKSLFFTIYHLALVISFYLCLLFTKSKSGIIAGIISLGIYFILFFIKNKINLFKFPGFLLLILLVSLTIFVNNPIKDYLFPPKVTSAPRVDIVITPSEDIRKIVWTGAFQLWRQFPAFGTGPETFAYTYYWVRPAAHNLTSEWDFLYNKAHNEYLNYLACTGTFGFLTYLLLIAVILYKIKNHPAVLAAFISILITNAAGFSVVIVSLYFFLLPAFTLPPPPLPSSKPNLIFKIFSLLFILFFSFLFIKNLYFYLADITYAEADSLDGSQNYSSAYNYIKLSLNYRPDEPVYLIKAADLSAKMALITSDKTYVTQSLNFMVQATKISPFSLNAWKEKAQTYYYLSTIDSNYYLYALDALTKATQLAPTDAKSFYMLGEFYQNINATDEAITNYQTAINLKSNYDYAYFALGKIYFSQKKYDKASADFVKVLSIAPNNTNAKDYLNLIATASAKIK